MNRIAAVAVVGALVGCVAVPQASNPQPAMTAAQQAVVGKCGPSPTPEPGGIGTCGAIICGPESNAHFQQREAIYAALST
jgi:uncharacterized low-complexity protein